jgi:type IV secretion system protein TrbI
MDDMINNHINDNSDPHESKISPDDPRLKIAQLKGKVLKKGPVLLVVSGVALLIVLAFLSTFRHSDKKGDKKNPGTKTEVAEKAQPVTVPEFITRAPDNKSPVSIAAASPALSNVPDLTEQPEVILNDEAPESKSKPKSAVHAVSVKNGYQTHNQTKSSQDLDADKAYGSGLFISSDAASRSAGSEQGVDKMSQDVLEIYKNQMAQSKTSYGNSPNIMSGSSSDSSTPADQNLQTHKNDFAGDLKGSPSKSNYVNSEIQKPKSTYQVMAGTIIPVSLITGINSDLPGMIVGQVRENVYDTVTGNYLLIPQGSRLIATYDSMISYAQNRVLVVWSRLIRPDGTSINFDSAPGTDLEGYAGLRDSVDYHFFRILSGVVLSSALSATVTRSQGATANTEDMNYNQAFAANAGSEINSLGQEITRKNINIQPTIKIRPGFSVNVLVNKDMILPPYKS